jgi:NAD+ kinase
MRFAIYSRHLKPKDLPTTRAFFQLMEDMGIELTIFKIYHEALKKHIHFKKPIELFETHKELKAAKADFMITLGGDGTILDTPILIRDLDLPLAGLNLGRLGFLANIEKVKMREAVEAIISRAFTVEKRSLLQLECNHPIFEGNNYALNDCTIVKRDTSSMIIVHTYINGEYLNSYWADGLIVATPTGSTGYSLSCGGPIIFPNSNNFIITPVAPHNLNIRPVVISDDAVVSFQIEGRANNFLCTLDSRFETVTSDYIIAVRKADFNFKLIRLHNSNFHANIRGKLLWGLDKRN